MKASSTCGNSIRSGNEMTQFDDMQYHVDDMSFHCQYKAAKYHCIHSSLVYSRVSPKVDRA